MNTLLVALILVAGFKPSHSEESYIDEDEYGDYEDYVDDSNEIPECGNKTNMHLNTRFISLFTHNYLRFTLANGMQRNGNDPKAGNFPPASDMSLLSYSCGLEEAAFNISEMCHNISDPSFSYVGSNNATHVGAVVNETIIMKLLMGWWNTSVENAPLVNLTPTANDSGMIPFLQMANANTTKVGCAYSTCNISFHHKQNPLTPPRPSVLFVCAYGRPYVNIGTPIYTNGTPCGTCNSSCAYKTLCNRTMV